MLVPVAPVQAQASGSPGPAERLVALLSETDTLRADVRQLVLDQAGREIEEERALLVMERPDHFYWEVIEPYEYLLVTDGDTIWQYEPDLEQVTIQEFSEDIDRTPILLLNSDAGTIAAAFRVMLSSPGDGETRFTLHPLTPGSLFERLTVTFVDGVIAEMNWETSIGQMTSLSFSNVETNITVDAGRFSFTPPAGVDVIDTRPQ